MLSNSILMYSPLCTYCVTFFTDCFLVFEPWHKAVGGGEKAPFPPNLYRQIHRM